MLLYKYYPYSKYLLELLLTKKAWYSKPEKFNDPFDCHLNFDENIPEDKYKVCLRWQLKREGRSQSQIEDDIKKLISPYGKAHETAKKIIDEISANTLNVIKNIGVFCLTEINNDVTMWAHYADSHRGMCLGFQISEKIRPEKVNYVPDAPKINFSNLFDHGLDDNEYKWIFSKHHSWMNEREWRIVVPEGNRLEPVPGEIKNVIFGLRMSNSEREVVKQILKNETGLEYFEAIRNSNLLQLEIIKLE